ncbi:CPS_collapsed_G0005910.mRNA.1.CDS.1 [Saccharomyces cerevisiae]|nr:CPS_collapsed_G0005910.mRNA.1.CDS.1 [Saccharomyces cerevisiae]
MTMNSIYKIFFLNNGLPILPLIDDLASWNSKKEYVSLVGQVLLDGLSLSNEEILQFSKEEEVPLVALSLPSGKFSDDEIIAFLNNGFLLCSLVAKMLKQPTTWLSN